MISGQLDRIEEGLAVIMLNDGEFQFEIPAYMVPSDVHDGDFITIDIKRDAEKTETALAEVLALMEDDED